MSKSKWVDCKVTLVYNVTILSDDIEDDDKIEEEVLDGIDDDTYGFEDCSIEILKTYEREADE